MRRVGGQDLKYMWLRLRAREKTLKKIPIRDSVWGMFSRLEITVCEMKGGNPQTGCIAMVLDVRHLEISEGKEKPWRLFYGKKIGAVPKKKREWAALAR